MSVPAHHRAGGGFRNPWPSGRLHGLGGFLKWTLLERRTRRPERRFVPPPPATPAYHVPRAGPDSLTLTWVGHSTFLIQLGDANLLTDPVWSARASPFQAVGPKRIAPPGVDFGQLPPIDIILISHDHYDHLDSGTVRRLVARYPGALWCAPLGVGRWLRRRGASRVEERDWGATIDVEGVAIRCMPAQHFSGRAPYGRDGTLWCGWVARRGARAVYFVGDTGYCPAFSALQGGGGALDAILMPIGAYDPRWFMQPVHVSPEEAVQAFLDVRAAGPDAHRTIMAGMHFGTFKLTDEPLDEPPDRTRAAWLAAGLPAADLWIPRHGETFAW